MATVLVTGANRGIGLALCRLLKERGDEVIGCCRRPSEALEALGVRVEVQVDVTDDASLARLAGRLDPGSVDVLINNAGVLRPDSLDMMDWDVLRQQFEVNTLGPLRVTRALRGALAQEAKVALVTSRMGSIQDNTSGSMYGYRMSKAALNMAGKSLALDLAPDGIAVALLHPGWVQTDMTGGRGHLSAAESAAGLIARIDGLNRDNSGSFWHANGELLPW